ncbi:MAG TPA: thiamine diphosphokinase [Eggerthellaceae bacterium]|nr:thiamine diphosphokinase [Eggerthellaceae bacterium]
MSCCALVAASDFNADDFERRRAAGTFDYVIAVDGGLASLRQVGCAPDLVLGDFDSLGFVPEGENVVVHPTHKDASDLQLALEECAARGFDSVVVYGALGGRLDHTIGCLQTCACFAERGHDVQLVGIQQAVCILVGPGFFDIPRAEQGTVSVFSATDESIGVTEQGLEYPLKNACLTNRTTLGLSNELTGVPASVAVESGTLYIVYPA